MAERKYTPGSIKIGPLSPRGTGQHYVEQRHAFPVSDRVCNASMPSDSRYSAKRDLSYRGMDTTPPSRGWRC